MSYGDPLSREYGIILAVVGPMMMERAHWYREMADLFDKQIGSGSEAASFMRMQADRADETIVSLGKKFGQK